MAKPTPIMWRAGADSSDPPGAMDLQSQSSNFNQGHLKAWSAAAQAAASCNANSVCTNDSPPGRANGRGPEVGRDAFPLALDGGNDPDLVSAAQASIDAGRLFSLGGGGGRTNRSGPRRTYSTKTKRIEERSRKERDRNGLPHRTRLFRSRESGVDNRTAARPEREEGVAHAPATANSAPRSNDEDVEGCPEQWGFENGWDGPQSIEGGGGANAQTTTSHCPPSPHIQCAGGAGRGGGTMDIEGMDVEMGEDEGMDVEMGEDEGMGVVMGEEAAMPGGSHHNEGMDAPGADAPGAVHGDKRERMCEGMDTEDTGDVREEGSFNRGHVEMPAPGERVLLDSEDVDSDEDEGLEREVCPGGDAFPVLEEHFGGGVGYALATAIAKQRGVGVGVHVGGDAPPGEVENGPDGAENEAVRRVVSPLMGIPVDCWEMVSAYAGPAGAYRCSRTSKATKRAIYRSSDTLKCIYSLLTRVGDGLESDGAAQSVENGGVGGDVSEFWRIVQNMGDGASFHDGRWWVVPRTDSDGEGPFDLDTPLYESMAAEINSEIRSRDPTKRDEYWDALPASFNVPPVLGKVAGKGDPIVWLEPETTAYKQALRKCRVGRCITAAQQATCFGGMCKCHAGCCSRPVQQELADQTSIGAADLSSDTVFNRAVGQSPLSDESARLLANGGWVFHWVDVDDIAKLECRNGVITMLPSTELSDATIESVGHEVDLSKKMSDRLWCTMSFLGGRGHVQKHGRSRSIVLGKGAIRFVAVFTQYHECNDIWTRFNINPSHANFVYAKVPGGIVPCLLLKVEFMDESITTIKMEIVEVNGTPLPTPMDARHARLDARGGKLVGVVGV
ncbi:hypothetical protein ACHAXT_009747 [Thalassiosira profunda]